MALVVRQLRGRPLTLIGLLWPVGLVGWFVIDYVRALPEGINPAMLVGGAVTVGAGLGVGCGLLTSIYRRPDGRLWARATIAAAALWLIGTGSRLLFELYATHGGGPALERFSQQHGLRGAGAWADALVLMALAEVLSRTVVLALRGPYSESRQRSQSVSWPRS